MWQEVYLDFLTAFVGFNVILNVINHAERIICCISWKKTIPRSKIAKLYWRHVEKLYGVPKMIYLDKDVVLLVCFVVTIGFGDRFNVIRCQVKSLPLLYHEQKTPSKSISET